MESEWFETRLGDVLTLQRGFDLPIQDRVSGNIPVIASTGKVGYHNKVAVSGPGVVIGRSGSIGGAQYLDDDFWPLNTTLWVKDFKGNDPYFCYSLLRNIDFKQFNVGSGVPTLNRNHIHPLPVCVPTLSGQCSISKILRSLDDRIDHNRVLAANLEAIARRLFKSWFVDFDPVRAKMAGEKPLGLADDIAALFPDRFVESEMGEIPEGWRVGCVDDEFSLTMGQSPPGSTYNEIGDGLPFYQGRTDFTFRFPKRRVFCSAPSRFAKLGETLVSVRAPVGDINMALEDCAIGRGVAAARHRSGSRSYTYHYMYSLEDVFANFEADGTVFGSISKKDFHAISCIGPSDKVIEAFEQVCNPIDGRLEICEQESRTLATLRDALLPKLISGEIRVSDVQSQIEESLV